MQFHALRYPVEKVQTRNEFGIPSDNECPKEGLRFRFPVWECLYDTTPYPESQEGKSNFFKFFSFAPNATILGNVAWRGHGYGIWRGLPGSAFRMLPLLPHTTSKKPSLFPYFLPITATFSPFFLLFKVNKDLSIPITLSLKFWSKYP